MQSGEIFAKGILFELVHLEQDDGQVFKVARRAPGVEISTLELYKDMAKHLTRRRISVEHVPLENSKR